MRQLKFSFLFCALVFISACAAPTPTLFSLAGTNWMLVSITQDGVTKPAPTGRNMSLRFSNDGKVSGRSVCNSYSGAYETQGEILKISALVATTMACADSTTLQIDNSLMDYEGMYLAGLEDAQLFEKRAEELTVTFADGNGKLVFKPG